jgi:hypothetical protein
MVFDQRNRSLPKNNKRIWYPSQAKHNPEVHLIAGSSPAPIRVLRATNWASTPAKAHLTYNGQSAPLASKDTL